jgi:hypothetical protein
VQAGATGFGDRDGQISAEQPVGHRVTSVERLIDRFSRIVGLDLDGDGLAAARAHAGETSRKN